jgi:putative oxidoreductase
VYRPPQDCRKRGSRRKLGRMSATTSLDHGFSHPNSTPGVWLRRLIDTRADIGATIARVGLGLVMFPHGAQKALGWFGGHGFSATLGFFTTKLGVPAPLAVLAILAESLGALALIAGVGTRAAALGIAVVMLVAIGMVHLPVGFFMNWAGTQAGEGFEYHLLALALAAIVIIKGGGTASIDRLLAKRFR